MWDTTAGPFQPPLYIRMARLDSMARALPFLLMFALVVYTVVDISSSDDDERLGVPAFAWIAIAILVPVLGPVAWIVVSRTQRAKKAAGQAGGTRGSTAPTPRPRPRRSGPVAPDDDPEFLRHLAQEQARHRREREQAEDGRPPSDDDGPRPADDNGDVPDDGTRS